VDALSLFANNAKEYFKNVNDCGICYSVVAADKTLPTKKCPNGHWFHGICLYRVCSLAKELTRSGSKLLTGRRVLYVWLVG
jgi:hypothetical protein